MTAGTRDISGLWRIAARAGRCGGAAAVAALATALVAACGSAPAGGQPDAINNGVGCPAAGLRVTLDSSAAGVAAGSSYLPLEFTNTSSSSCRVDGYPAVALVTGISGRQIGSTGTHDRAITPRPVTLAPGATAHAWLQIAAAGNFPAQLCHPVTADWLRVRPPGAARPSYLQHRIPACAAAPRGSHLLLVQPVEPGRARRGTA
jgi:Protein of unknown function (DUF4232)